MSHADLIKCLREGDWNIRSPQEMADMIADAFESLPSSPPADAVALFREAMEWGHEESTEYFATHAGDMAREFAQRLAGGQA